MNQIARPVADLATGNWTPTPIYPEVNGSVGGGQVASAAGGGGDTFEVKLADLAWPQHWRDGNPQQRLTVVQARSGTGDDVLCTVTLLQDGDGVIATKEAEGAEAVTINLTREQVELITNYHALSVRVTAGKPKVLCCGDPPPEMPVTLLATLSNSSCSELNGKRIPLSRTSNPAQWRGSLPNVAGMKLWIGIECTGDSVDDFRLFGEWSNYKTCGTPITNHNPPSATCDPLYLHFIGYLSLTEACPCGPVTDLTVDIEITEYPNPPNP